MYRPLHVLHTCTTAISQCVNHFIQGFSIIYTLERSKFKERKFKILISICRQYEESGARTRVTVATRIYAAMGTLLLSSTKVKVKAGTFT